MRDEGQPPNSRISILTLVRLQYTPVPLVSCSQATGLQSRLSQFLSESDSSSLAKNPPEALIWPESTNSGELWAAGVRYPLHSESTEIRIAEGSCEAKGLGIDELS